MTCNTKLVYICNTGRSFYQPPQMVDYRIKMLQSAFFMQKHMRRKGELMSVKIFMEVFGYIGTAVVISSMLMTSVTKLRVVNICGAVMSLIYAAYCNTWPVVLLNGTLAVINIIQLIRAKIKKGRVDGAENGANGINC